MTGGVPRPDVAGAGGAPASEGPAPAPTTPDDGAPPAPARPDLSAAKRALLERRLRQSTTMPAAADAATAGTTTATAGTTTAAAATTTATAGPGPTSAAATPPAADGAPAPGLAAITGRTLGPSPTAVPSARGPVVVVGYSLPFQLGFDTFQPTGSVVFVEEPDVVVGRNARAHLAECRSLRELVEFEYQRPGAADAFFLRHRDLRPSAVIPGMEYAVPFAARLAERYGLPGAGLGAAEILRDKAALRAVTAAAGIANPRSQAVEGRNALRAFMAEHGGPVVLKPANRQGSVGTRILTDPCQVHEAWADCTDQDEGGFAPRRGMPLRMLVEQFVEGDEYSVEVLVRDGTPLFANVTGKVLYPGPRPIERGHTVPADLPADVGERLVAATARVLEAVGFGTGFAHCEWILSGGTPYLVECAGRMPGDGIVELIEKAWNVEIVRLYATVMKGLPVNEALPARPGRGAAAWFLDVAPGRVVAVGGVDEARAVPGVSTVVVSAAPGDEVHPLRSSWDRVAYATASSTTAAGALAAAQQAIAAITVTVEPADQRR